MGLNFANSTSLSGFVSDFWRYTAAHQGNTVLLGSNWERPDTGNQGFVGGMSESSGTFSFCTSFSSMFMPSAIIF